MLYAFDKESRSEASLCRGPERTCLSSCVVSNANLVSVKPMQLRRAARCSWRQGNYVVTIRPGCGNQFLHGREARKVVGLPRRDYADELGVKRGLRFHQGVSHRLGTREQERIGTVR